MSSASAVHRPDRSAGLLLRSEIAVAARQQREHQRMLRQYLPRRLDFRTLTAPGPAARAPFRASGRARGSVVLSAAPNVGRRQRTRVAKVALARQADMTDILSGVAPTRVPVSGGSPPCPCPRISRRSPPPHSPHPHWPWPFRRRRTPPASTTTARTSTRRTRTAWSPRGPRQDGGTPVTSFKRPTRSTGRGAAQRRPGPGQRPRGLREALTSAPRRSRLDSHPPPGES